MGSERRAEVVLVSSDEVQSETGAKQWIGPILIGILAVGVFISIALLTLWISTNAINNVETVLKLERDALSAYSDARAAAARGVDDLEAEASDAQELPDLSQVIDEKVARELAAVAEDSSTLVIAQHKLLKGYDELHLEAPDLTVLTPSELNAIADARTASAKDLSTKTSGLSDIGGRAGDQLSALRGALSDAAASAEASVGGLVAHYASAGQAEKDAATSAAAEAADAPASQISGKLADYAAAIAALAASHAAAVAVPPPGVPDGNLGYYAPDGSFTPGGGGSDGGDTGGDGSTPPAQDTNRYASPLGPYSPGCSIAAEYYRQDPGPGGTAIIGSMTVPYDYRIEGTWVVVYVCF